MEPRAKTYNFCTWLTQNESHGRKMRWILRQELVFHVSYRMYGLVHTYIIDLTDLKPSEMDQIGKKGWELYWIKREMCQTKHLWVINYALLFLFKPKLSRYHLYLNLEWDSFLSILLYGIKLKDGVKEILVSLLENKEIHTKQNLIFRRIEIKFAEKWKVFRNSLSKLRKKHPRAYIIS